MVPDITTFYQLRRSFAKNKKANANLSSLLDLTTTLQEMQEMEEQAKQHQGGATSRHQAVGTPGPTTGFSQIN